MAVLVLVKKAGVFMAVLVLVIMAVLVLVTLS